MGAIHSLARRSLLARRARSLLTILGIGLGIGVLVAAVATNATLDGASAATVRDLLGRADLRVSALEERGLSSASVAAAASAPGVAVAAPQLGARTYLRPSATAGGSALRAPVTVLGVDPGLDPQVHDRPLVSGTALPSGEADAALVSEPLARADGLAVGDTITLEGAAEAEPVTLTVAGILAGPGEPDPGGRTVLMPLATASSLFASDRVSWVDVVAAEGTDPSAVEQALVDTLILEPYSLTTPAEAEAALSASTAGLRGTIALVAVVVLFGAAFLVFNTLAMTVVERVREVGLLRAAGMTRRQVRLLVLFQAGHLGVGGAIVGLVLGIGLAAAVTVLLGRAGPVAMGDLVLPPLGIGLALLIGLAVTAAAALEPAFVAGSIPPVEALKLRADLAAGRAVRLRWLVLVFLAVGAVGLLLVPGPGSAGGFLRPLAVYGILLVAVLAVPLILGPLGRIAGLLFAPVLPLEERLTRGALVRDRSRAALTVGALAVAVAMIVALGGVGASARAAADAWLAEVVPGTEVLVSIRPVTLDEPGMADLMADLRAVEGVERLSPIGRFAIAAGGYRLDAVAISGADFAADGRLRFVAGDSAAALAALDAGGATILPRAKADALGLGPGGTLTATTAGGPVALQVAGIVERSLPGDSGEAVLVGWPDASLLGALGADLFAVRYAPGAEASARPALDELAQTYALQPTGLDDVRGAVGSVLERMFGLLDSLAIVALVVAALGIVNTLSMNVLERVREIGVLRAAGLARRQVWRMVVVEAAILGLVGATVGATAGLAAAAILVLAAGGPVPVFDPAWLKLAAAVAGAVVISALAAAYPARIAGRIEIVRAVSFE